MNKEEFLEKEKRVKDNLVRLTEELRSLQDEYIASNTPYPIGTKILIKTTYPSWRIRERYAFVVGYRLRKGDVIPTLKKAKKDGSISKIDDSIMYEKVEITKVEE